MPNARELAAGEMLLIIAALLAGGAGWILARDGPGRRLEAVLPRPLPDGPPQETHPSPAVRQLAVAIAAGVAVYIIVGGLAGLPAALAALAGVRWALARRPSPALRRIRARMLSDLPVAAELMASCLRAGSPPDLATGVVADALGGPLGERLGEVAGRLRLGAEPYRAWLTLSHEPATEGLARFARAVARAAESGAPLADLLDRVAEDARRESRAEADAVARRVGVYAVAPLGLCFLPAFVLLGVVPLVAGLAADIQIF